MAVRISTLVLIFCFSVTARAQTFFLGFTDVWTQDYTYTFFPLDPVSGQQVQTTCRVSATQEYRNIRFELREFRRLMLT